MGTPYVGEIRMFAGNFAPVGWLLCQGQLLPISENETLFNLIGTTYGGDGQETFALPDLRGRVPAHFATSFPFAEIGGSETVTLTTQQIPAHSHVPLCNSNPGGQSEPTNALWAQTPNASYASGISPTINMGSNAIGPTGGSQPHDNMVPYLAINFIISLFGVFPSQT
jgi:microcystin-dependent protein